MRRLSTVVDASSKSTLAKFNCLTAQSVVRRRRPNAALQSACSRVARLTIREIDHAAPTCRALPSPRCRMRSSKMRQEPAASAEDEPFGHRLLSVCHQLFRHCRLMLIDQFIADESGVLQVIGQSMRASRQLGGAHCQWRVMECNHDIKRMGWKMICS